MPLYQLNNVSKMGPIIEIITSSYALVIDIDFKVIWDQFPVFFMKSPSWWCL